MQFCSLIVSKYGENQIDVSIQKLLQSKVEIKKKLYCQSKYIHTTQDSRFFDKLGVLCVCNDRPIPEKQSRQFICIIKLLWHLQAQLLRSWLGNMGRFI